MKEYHIKHSQNGWEYTGIYKVHCKHSCERKGLQTLIIDDEIVIVFDEEFVLVPVED